MDMTEDVVQCMEITISDEDAARIPAIVEQFAPAAFMDYSIEEKKMTLK